MALQSPAEAIRQARRLLALPEGDDGEAHLVRRLDVPRGAYFLVRAEGRIAALDAATGDLMASAETARSPVCLSRDDALARAGLGGEPDAELAWGPSAATLSMFDPLWAVSAGGRSVYVDQRGRVWPELPVKRPGGGGQAG
jgi:hypothetical protein